MRCSCLRRWGCVLYVKSRVELMPGLCALDVCWPSLGLCAFDVSRTRCAALYVSPYVQSRIVLLPALWALNVCWPSLGLCAFDVNRIRGAALCVDRYVQSRIMLLLALCALDVCWQSIRLCALNVNQSPLGWTAVREPICAVPGCAPAGTICARRVLAEPRVVCVRRKSNPLCCPVCGHIMCSPGLCSCGDYVRSTCAGRAYGCVRSMETDPRWDHGILFAM